MSYCISKSVNGQFESVTQKVIEELQKVGFGIVSEIDMQGKLKEKLDVNIPKYLILGACNPKFAYEAIKVESNIGVFLPCNVIVKEDDKGQVEVSAIDPVETMGVMGNPGIEELGKSVKEKLEQVISAL